MLKLHFGLLPDTLLSGNGYFDNWVDGSCLESEFAKDIVKGVDNSELVSRNLVISPVIGSIPPSYLSGGVKTLLILMYTDKVVDLSAMGDNCLPYLVDISRQKDIILTCCEFKDLFAYGISEIFIMNDNIIVSSREELVDIYMKHRGDLW